MEKNPIVTAALVYEWVYGHLSAEEEKNVIELLLASSPAAVHNPKVRMLAFLDETSDLHLGEDYGSVTTRELRRALPRAVAGALEAQSVHRLYHMVTSTDHLELLASLHGYRPETGRSGVDSKVQHVIRRNPNLNRAIGYHWLGPFPADRPVAPASGGRGASGSSDGYQRGVSAAGGTASSRAGSSSPGGHRGGGGRGVDGFGPDGEYGSGTTYGGGSFDHGGWGGGGGRSGGGRSDRDSGYEDDRD